MQLGEMGVRERNGLKIIANNPFAPPIIYRSKAEACRVIGCKFEKLDRAIASGEPIRINGRLYWIDELEEL